MTGTAPSDFTSDTGQPVALEPGDICITATYREGEVDIRRNIGEGRVLVYDADLALKGALWTGETGLVLGLGYCTYSKTLFASDATSQTVTRFSTDGARLPSFPAMQGKPFGASAFGAGGKVLIGEHIKGDKPPFLGGGKIHCFDADGSLLSHHAAEHDPGKFGFHGVTNMALASDGNTVIYISETGKRVMQYDIADDRQLPDLFCLAEDDDRVTAGIGLLPDGNILMGHVHGASLFLPTGETLKAYDIPQDRGWAAVRVGADGVSFLIANFFTGRLEKRALDSGDIIAATDTGMVFALASIAEIT